MKLYFFSLLFFPSSLLALIWVKCPLFIFKLISHMYVLMNTLSGLLLSCM